MCKKEMFLELLIVLLSLITLFLGNSKMYSKVTLYGGKIHSKIYEYCIELIVIGVYKEVLFGIKKEI